MSVFIDPRTLELDLKVQKTVKLSAYIIGVPTAMGVLAYEIYIRNMPAVFLTGTLVFLMLSALPFIFTGKNPDTQYLATKSFSLFFMLGYAFVLIYYSINGTSIWELLFAYSLPITAYLLLGIKLAAPMLFLFHCIFSYELINRLVSPAVDMETRRTLLMILFSQPIVSFISYLTIRILKKGQLDLQEKKNLLEKSESDYKEVNQQLNAEIEERKKYEAELKNMLKTKELLLKEIHHRVKNNLQMISSLFNLESENISSPPFQELLKRNQLRIQAMQLVHDMFYSAKDFGRIDLHDFIEEIVYGIYSSYRQNSSHIKISIDIPHAALSLNTAIPFGLLINEVVTNSFKHAFIGRTEGLLSITVTSDRLGDTLFIADDGPGYEQPKSVEQRVSLGNTLIGALTKQLDGILTTNDDCNGKWYRIFFRNGSRFKNVNDNG